MVKCNIMQREVVRKVHRVQCPEISLISEYLGTESMEPKTRRFAHEEAGKRVLHTVSSQQKGSYACHRAAFHARQRADPPFHLLTSFHVAG
jgi:hypothetical protein